MKKSIIILLCVLAIAITSCKNNDVYFVYSPKMPHAGQTIVFSNQTTEGEDWAWSFGDGSTSTSKSPSKIYKQTGTYTVTLKVDNKASRTYTTTITIADTIPSIGLSDTVVYYFQPITMKAEAYNPFSKTQNYEWHLPANTQIISGDTASRSLTVLFKDCDQEVEVSCLYTQGDSARNIRTSIFVEDQPARALVQARSGDIRRMRIYEYGIEKASSYDISWGNAASQPSSIQVVDDKLYIFNADQTTNGMIACYNIKNNACEVLIKNATDGEGQGFEHGFTDANYLYWTAADNIYKAPIVGTNRSFTAGGDMLFANAANVGNGLATGKESGGLTRYNNVFAYAYDKGLYFFSDNEIGGTAANAPILTDQQIRRFAIDKINRKVYFATESGLYISNIDGSQVVLIDAQANSKSILIANEDNLLFWTTEEGVFYMPLVKTGNNRFTQEKVQLNSDGDVCALAIDGTPRYLNR